MIDTRARHALGASTLVVALASLLLACSGSPDTTSGGGTSPSHDVRTTASAPAAEEPAAGEPAAADATEPAPGSRRSAMCSPGSRPPTTTGARPPGTASTSSAGCSTS
ncbi:hypothetical protein E4K10_18715 [Streptomyces sp. T1317-0309]|nr:hypothetical protein E4K10_18715 [Streptomyces sp. T1317-0309]